jgi:putative ABC transport system permease protein
MTLATDVTLAARSLRKHPGFATSVVATLGIAVAASTTIALVADQVLLRPLPYRDPARLVMIWEKASGADFRLASYLTFLDWQRTSRAFAGLGYARGSLDVLATRDGPVRATTAFVSPGFLTTLGARPTAGRFFTSDEEAPGRGNAVVLSEGFWRSQFGGDPAVIGTSVTLRDHAVTIVGVLSRSMGYPLWADMWRPISAIVDTDKALASRHHHTDSRVLGRLRDGVTAAAAMTELATVQRRLATAYPDHGAEWTGADYKPLDWEFVGDSAPALGTLAGAVALTLLVACVNMATLLLLRAFGREREFAIRAALGAGRARLVRLTLIETGLLGAGAMMLAAALTWGSLTLIRTTAPDSLPRASELMFGGRALALVVALTIVAALVAASAPALRSLRDGGAEALRAGWQPTSGGRGGSRWRASLVTTQLALALTLVTGAALLLESFRKLRQVDLGFDPERLAAFWISPPSPKYDAPEQAAALYQRAQQAAIAVPGVDGVAIVNHVPLGGGWVVTNVAVPGRTGASDGSDAAIYKTVSENYLRVMKGRLLRGRWFNDVDIRGAGNGVVINDRMARHFWPNKDPIGQPLTVFRSSQFRADYGAAEPSVVLGVITDMHQLSISDDPVDEVYVPYTREVWPGVALLIRTRGDSRSVERPLRRAMLAVEPDLPVSGSTRWRSFDPIGENVARALAPRRTVMRLVLAFAVAALALAAIGVYGVTAFGVAQRRREFGIRMALGATSRNVIALVLRQSATFAAVGAVIGVAGAFALARVLRASLDSVLYRTSPFAVVPLVVAGAVLGGVAVAAAFAPARRAGDADPMVALRSE